ncbi:hypothetical protein [Notoacmeibacter sp. MSK16QG-6]|uniref:hypothetical protein n=1 Tax=Notoacmeibacter sp. MSK16QG-6 TaxID=2957982 RepID=UPI00209F1A4F|nr:hypothetical protein [Notoacmeibacter sp. MSK16QG-6]MCP1198811.1 hypothetical protein [Notoacmeibacter sp. MSK16QG-6]
MIRTLLIVFSIFLAGCKATSGTVTRIDDGTSAPSTLSVCSGFGCKFREHFTISAKERAHLRSIMAQGSVSPDAERRAIRRATALMERLAQRKLGFAADAPLSHQRHAKQRGQMDCYDESQNTRTYLDWLQSAGMIRHHKSLRKIAQRGYLLDGRYPHKTALIRETSGKVWAVDSWRGRNGQPPEIIPLSRWKASDRSDFAYNPSI